MRDVFWKYLDILVLEACMSAFIWAVIWVFGFIILTILSVQAGIPTQTTALALTFAVVLGHLPKFVAMFLGTDTDFQNFKKEYAQFSLRNAEWLRAFIAGGLICYLMFHIVPKRLDALKMDIDPTTVVGFMETSWNQLWGSSYIVRYSSGIWLAAEKPLRRNVMKGSYKSSHNLY